MTNGLQPPVHQPGNIGQARNAARSMFDPSIARPALVDSFRKLAPRHQLRNPVMFCVYIGSILTKLRLPEADDMHRRVLAVLTFLNERLADLAEEPPDAIRRKLGLRQEAERAALDDQLGIVVGGVRRDHDDRQVSGVTLGELACEIETVFVTEHDIDENHIWP